MALVDDVYGEFTSSLPENLRAEARALAHTLGLAPHGIPWSEVFGHAVTLGAPALVAEAMAEVPVTVVTNAVKAHALAVIEAFGSDRIADHQVEVTDALCELLAHVRKARDAALHQVAPSLTNPRASYARADEETRRAIAVERTLLVSGASVSFARYEAISLGKQRVGFPASIALAHVAGWDERRRRALERLLAGVWLGLQMHDDVVDWSDDLARGGAWALALARGLMERASMRDRKTMPPSVRNVVFDSAALVVMLQRARRHYRAAARLGTVLGTKQLAAWAAEREAQLAALVEEEQRSAGATNRKYALDAWAREVLS